MTTRKGQCALCCILGQVYEDPKPLQPIKERTAKGRKITSYGDLAVDGTYQELCKFNEGEPRFEVMLKSIQGGFGGTEINNC